MAERGSAAGLIGLCRRAGKLKTGMDAACAACRAREAKGVFVTHDLSQKSLKEIAFFCKKHSVSLYRLPISMDEAQEAMGKRVGIFAVTDQGFARGFAKGGEIIPPDTILRENIKEAAYE